MTRRLEPQDLYAIKLVEDPQITPDGERIAYLVAEIDRESYEYHRSIWVADVASTALHRYTAGNNDRSPRWSPDGRSLAFVRGPAGEVKPKNKEERDRGVGKAQLWVLPADGGEARQLTWLRDGAGQPTWSPDGATIVFSAEVGQPDDVEAADAQLEEKNVPAVRTIDRLWTGSMEKAGSTSAAPIFFGFRVAAAISSSSPTATGTTARPPSRRTAR